MKKVLLIPVIAGAWVLIFSSAYAFQGWGQGMWGERQDSMEWQGRGQMHMRDSFRGERHGQHEALSKVLDEGDYDAFLEIAPAPLLEHIDTEDKFVLFVELHEAMGMEDTERVKELQEELWLKGDMRGERQGMRGEWRGQGHEGKGGGHEKGNPADHIAGIAASDLSVSETDLLMKQYEEEMMANELYTSFYEMYGTQVFANIAVSEAHHMDAVNVLLERYDLDAPTNYDHIQSLYDELKAKGALSLQDALEVGLMIEKVDIDDIAYAIKNTDNDDIQTIFVFIGGASYNHMRGFARNIDMQGFETDVDFSQYLDAADLEIRGPLHLKLTERLEDEGVSLPEGATSEAVKKHMEAKRWDYEEGNRGDHDGMKKRMEYMKKGKKSRDEFVAHSQKERTQGNLRKWTGNTRGVKMSYKRLIMDKFGDKLPSWDDARLEKVQTKIGAYRERLWANNAFTAEKKDTIYAVLEALEEVIDEQRSGDEVSDLVGEILE